MGMSYYLFQLPTRYLYSSWKNQGGDILQGWYKVKWEEGKGTCTSWRCWREEEAQRRRPAAPLNLYVYNHCTLVYHQVLLLLLQTALALLYIVVKGKTWYTRWDVKCRNLEDTHTLQLKAHFVAKNSCWRIFASLCCVQRWTNWVRDKSNIQMISLLTPFFSK